MLQTPVLVASNAGAVRVRSNGEGSKSASAPDHAVKFKKQGRAPGKYVRPNEWKLVRRYRACIHASFDAEDIKFDIYEYACKLIELSCHRMFPHQDEAANGLHLLTLKRQANAVSNGVTIREYACPLCFFCHCRVDLRTVEGTGFIQLKRCGLHPINSHAGI